MAVFSPVALTPEVKTVAQSLGPVKYIAALDFEHHIFLGPWHQEYPDAKVIGIEGLPEKRAKQQNEKVRFDYIFKKGTTIKIDDEFDEGFEYEYVPGHANKELVFLAKHEKTLIEGDLLFNLPASEQYSKSKESPVEGLWTRLFNSFMGTTGSTATWQQRFIWYVASKGDRPGFNKSVQRISNWNFDRIIPCHGDVIETGGKELFDRMFRFHLDAFSESQKKPNPQ